MFVEGRIETIRLQENENFLEIDGLDLAAEAVQLCECLPNPAAYSTNELL